MIAAREPRLHGYAALVAMAAASFGLPLGLRLGDALARPFSNPHEIVGWTSLPRGVVGLAEALGGDIISSTVYDAMVDELGDMLAPFEDAYRITERIAAGEVQMLGASGTVTTLAGVHLKLSRYDRARVDGIRMSFDEIHKVSAHLQGLDLAARAAIPTIGPDRADLVVAGCAILDAIKRTWPVGVIRVADRGVREGLLMGMMHPCIPMAAGYVVNPGRELAAFAITVQIAPSVPNVPARHG